VALAERLARAEDGVANGAAALVTTTDGLAPVLVRVEPEPDGRAVLWLAPLWLARLWLARLWLAPLGPAAAEPVVACERGGAGLVVPAVADGRVVRSAGAVDGLNVATDSIAPATRHTARMLASSGMTVPGPENGLVSRCSRFRRRCARSSRW
jgi:hypothetical protein